MKLIATLREDFHFQVKYRIFAFLSPTINNIKLHFFSLCIGIPVEVYQYQVAGDCRSCRWVEVERPEHTVIDIKGFPDDPFARGTYQVAFKTERIAPSELLTGTKFVFKQPKTDNYGVSEENAITKVNSVFKMTLELKINPTLYMSHVH